MSSYPVNFSLKKKLFKGLQDYCTFLMQESFICWFLLYRFQRYSPYVHKKKKVATFLEYNLWSALDTFSPIFITFASGWQQLASMGKNYCLFLKPTRGHCNHLIFDPPKSKPNFLQPAWSTHGKCSFFFSVFIVQLNWCLVDILCRLSGWFISLHQKLTASRSENAAEDFHCLKDIWRQNCLCRALFIQKQYIKDHRILMYL